MSQVAVPEKLQDYKVPEVPEDGLTWFRNTELRHWGDFDLFLTGLKDEQLLWPDALELYKSTLNEIVKHPSVSRQVRTHVKALSKWVSVGIFK